MKNKHLVFIFLLTLVFGLLVRKFPWRVSEMFQADLITIDTSALQNISINQAGVSELLLERTDMGWVAEQDGRPVTVSETDMQPLLIALSHIQTLRILKSKQPDTLGLRAAIAVKATLNGGRQELFYIGRQTLEDDSPATYVELDNNKGIYLVKSHLRDIFNKTIAQFRKNIAVAFEQNAVSDISIVWEKRDSSAYWKRNDSLLCWEAGALRLPLDSMRRWLRWLPELNGRPFADHFDDSRSRETLFATVTLQNQSGVPALELSFFYLAPPDIPEDFSVLGDRQQYLSAWVLQSSQNPYNYFSITDTTLLHHIFYDLSR